MATEENDSSLYSALYKAISDPRLIGDLLQHPEFRRRAREICRGIAGPADVEDLLQAACLRVLEHASQLDPNSIRGEGEFFGWFTQLARHVHLSNILSAAALNRCTDTPGRWPDASADVPPDDVVRFLAHADACPYHTKILRAEEEAVRAAFNGARGLDSQGRILLGEELHARVAEHRRRMESWRESAFEKGVPVGHVALYNGGREIASCGEFYDFSIHKSVNELVPSAGLQIYGVCSGGARKKVLLGFYALAGVCHEGLERTLKLENGYTVGLKVWERGGTTFKIQFRCVETSRLEAELNGTGDDSDFTDEETPDVERPGGPTTHHGLPATPIYDVPVAAARSGWWPMHRRMQAVAVSVFMVLLAFACVKIGKVWGQADALIIASPPTGRSEAAAPGKPPDLTRAAAQELPTKDVAARPTPPPPTTPKSRETRGEPPPPETAGRPRRDASPPSATAAAARPTREQTRGARARPEAATRGGARLTPGDKAKLNFAAAALRGDEHRVTHITGMNEVSTTRLLSYEVPGASAGSSALHITTDDFLGRKLSGALRGEKLRVERVVGQSPAPATFKVKWDVSTDSTRRAKWFVVTLNAYISKGGERNSPEPLSYMGVGNNWDAAYNDAIKKAVKPVITQIRDESAEALNASAAAPAGDEQLTLAPPWGTSTAVYEGGDMADADDGKPDKSETENFKCMALEAVTKSSF